MNTARDKDSKYYDDEFSVKDLFEIISSSRLTIIIFGLFFFLSFSSFSLMQSDMYTSDTLLRVNDTENESSISRLASSYSGLASMAGVNLQTNSNSKSNLVLATIRSKEFFEHLSQFNNVLPNLVAATGYDEELDQVLFDSDLYIPGEGGWQISPPLPLNVHHKFLDSIVVSLDQETGFIYLSVNHVSPRFAFYLCNLIFKETNNLIRNKQLSESYKAQEFLNEQLKKNLSLEVKRSTAQILQAQLQIQMIADIRDDYVISPIDKPYIPLGISGPNRLKNSFIGLVLGLFLGIFYSLVRAYFSTVK